MTGNKNGHSSPSNLCSAKPKHKHLTRQQIQECQPNVWSKGQERKQCKTKTQIIYLVRRHAVIESIVQGRDCIVATIFHTIVSCCISVKHFSLSDKFVLVKLVVSLCLGKDDAARVTNRLHGFQKSCKCPISDTQCHSREQTSVPYSFKRHQLAFCMARGKTKQRFQQQLRKAFFVHLQCILYNPLSFISKHKVIRINPVHKFF